MLLEGKTDWIVRRKETVAVLSESALRHCLSLDFEVPELPRHDMSGHEYRCVPLGLLRKEPGRFTRFDFEDETGSALPLPSRADNARISGSVLVEAARRVLSHDLSPTLEAELRRIARAEKDRALALVQEAYKEPHPEFADDEDAASRSALWANADFRWLLRTLAYSSLTVAVMRCDGQDRRVIKLRYDEKTADTTRLRRRPFLARIGGLGHRLGWRGYIEQVVSPFIGARTYHFELHAPEGMELLEAGIEGRTIVHDDRHRAHLYFEDARHDRTAVVYSQFRIRGAGFVSAAFLTSLLIAFSLAVAYWKGTELSGSTTSAPALLVLFPGLIASYFARPIHPLVSRLLQLARLALVCAAALAYVAAGRLALISTQHPADPKTLDDFFRWLVVGSGIATVALLLTLCLPLRLNGPIRSRFRRSRR